MEKLNVAGVVLAGGLSRRFGEDKAMYHGQDGKLWAEKMISKLKPFCKTIFLSVNQNQFAFFQQFFQNDPTIHVIVDLESMTAFGPLAGLYSVIQQASSFSSFLIVPIDTPHLKQSELKCLLRHPNHFAKTTSQNHYLIAHLPSYHEALTETLSQDKNRVRDLLKRLGTKPLLFTQEAAFKNYNNKPEI
ncbi:molybdenum cofactor guanylyltransferase [Listeria sp. PSOL-1]|uniref:molybdenum cofactor guanylyltransferase n=1 Tax=Listeria sp. PSOL-1 TaxID=1844999 RepID=UPI0013D7CE96|nr:molybdenum cofactor guanylyltransferase [Listeria sp. PSOL-1]